MFWEEYHRGDMPFSLHHIRQYMILAGDANLRHLAKVVLARFLQCEVIIFLFLLSSFGSKPLSVAHSGAGRSEGLLSSISESRVYLLTLFGFLV